MIGMGQPPLGTTIVKNRLQYPTGEPRSGEKVEFLVRAVTDWREDHTGRIVSTANTWTSADGCWRIPLLPWTAYQAQRNTVVEVREGGMTTGLIQVAPPEEGAERWMRDLLVAPPAPPSPWQPISRLSDLHDVDHTSLDGAPDGAVLVKRGGMWRAEVPNFGKDRLAELRDVDESVSWAQSTDPLVYLSSAQGWGVTREKPATIRAEFAYDPDDSYTVWIGVTAYDSSKDTAIYWGDDTDDTPVTATGDYAHTYTTAGTYYLAVYYLDQTEMVEFPNTVIPNPTPKGNA